MSSEEEQSKLHPKNGLALALQGSFGHIQYALGIMAALQKRGREHHPDQPFPFIVASGCVEMLLPLWLYFSRIDIHDYVQHEPPAINLLPGPSADSWWNYMTSTMTSTMAILCPPYNERTLEKMATMPFVPPAGLMHFNRQYYEGEAGQRLATFMDKVKVPVFTNALDAGSFREVYLYSGQLDDQKPKQILGKKGAAGKRGLEKLTLERFVASGARPPFFAPIKVGTRRGQDEYWMEGAMRCDPPLNPLIDVGATQILLIRFFAKRKATGQVDNQLELFDRYLDAIFSAPLEKEIETVHAINHLILECRTAGHATTKKPVEILDPSEHVGDFMRFLENDLDYLSHFRIYNLLQWQDMFERGEEVGHAIFDHYGILGSS